MANKFVEELRWRGMVHDIMPGTEEQLNKEMTTTYIGFDPTSDSLHIGSLVPIILLVHVFHLSTGKETKLFSNKLPLKDKKITAEVCVHHLWFSDEDYDQKGTLIKWNPAVKTATDRDQLWKALLDDRIDVIATDHAPHTLEEKNNVYTKAPSGGPLVQHALVAMLEAHHKGKISLEKIAEKMCHNPSILFQVEKRGYIKEGYFADLVIVDLNSPWSVKKDNILYQCGWSPFEGTVFKSRITHTFLNGTLVYNNFKVLDVKAAKRLTFNR